MDIIEIRLFAIYRNDSINPSTTYPSQSITILKYNEYVVTKNNELCMNIVATVSPNSEYKRSEISTLFITYRARFKKNEAQKKVLKSKVQR